MKLSNKQQINIEHMWELENQENQNLIEMAKALQGLKQERMSIRAEIESIEEQVPESSENAWENTDAGHRSNRNLVEREQWLSAYGFLKNILGRD